MQIRLYVCDGYHKKNTSNFMDQSDIQYVIEILNDAITEKDWETVEDARETLKEFLDADELPDNE